MKLVGIHLFLEYLLSSYLVDLNPQVPRCHSLHGILPWQLVLALHFLVVVLTGVQVLVSAVQPSESAPHTHITLLPWISSPLRPPDHTTELCATQWALVSYLFHT